MKRPGEVIVEFTIQWVEKAEADFNTADYLCKAGSSHDPQIFQLFCKPKEAREGTRCGRPVARGAVSSWPAAPPFIGCIHRQQLDKSDGEILEWVENNAKHKHASHEIIAWSAWSEQRAPSDVETRAYFNDQVSKNLAKREDIGTFFEWLDADDFVSFGGKA